MENTYTKREVINKVKNYLLLFNKDGNLTCEDYLIIGIVDQSLREKRTTVPEMTARIGRQYPKTISL